MYYPDGIYPIDDIPEPVEPEIENPAEFDPAARAAGMGIAAFFWLCALGFVLFVRFCTWLYEQYETHRYWQEIHKEHPGYRYQIDGHLCPRASEPHVRSRKHYGPEERVSDKASSIFPIGTGERGRWHYG